jgi:hypothetical protein
MSWNSLFAFSNPTGRVGSQYTAISNSTLNGVALDAPVNGVTNLAQFPSLPIGVYSISVQYQVDIPANAAINIIQYFWSIGVSTIGSTSPIIYPSINIGAPSTSINPLTTNTNAPINANFIVSVTSSNTIYINNIYFMNSSNIVFFDNPVNIVCIATKMA